MMKEEKVYDVVIIGAGVSGTALLYSLCNYTNVRKIALIEKHGNVAEVNSNKKSNSQTLHFGDIETNYSLNKAKETKRHANMVKSYLLKYDNNKKIHNKYSKMVLAVGDDQIEKLKLRYVDFKDLFPGLKYIERNEIKKLEPKVVEGRDSGEKIGALYSEEGYAIDFQKLSESFVENSGKKKNKEIDLNFNVKVRKIRKERDRFVIKTNKGNFLAKAVAVEAGAHSLLLAKQMGYAKCCALLSIAGSFYITPKVLNGKVYTLQKKKLPFAAIHGDPEVDDPNITRFGPTAKALPMLERHDYKTFFSYFMTAGLGFRAFRSYIKILSDKIIFPFIMKNFIYDLPYFGRRAFLKEARKIVPTLRLEDLKFAKGYGGMRPQIIDLDSGKLEMGDAKIVEGNIIFNITPSPGASNCLRNAEEDTETLVGFLGKEYRFDKKRFCKDFGVDEFKIDN
jgi:malate dehydrogenase (quinone)